MVVSRITGSLGELSWEGKAEGPIIHYDFLTQKTTEVRCPPPLAGPNIGG